MAMPLPAGLPLGYHRLAVGAGGAEAEIDLVVAPRRCHLPPQLGDGARGWGLTCQLYGLRSAHDWGMGDFTDLAEIAAGAGANGAAVLGVNPLHARFAAEPLHISPYSPSSRTWLDYLYIDATAAPGFAEDETAQSLIGGEWFGATRWAARSAELIDYGAVAACKRPVLEALYRRFRTTDLGDLGDLGDPARRIPFWASPFAGFSARAGDRCAISPCSRLCTSISVAKSAAFRGAAGRCRCATRARPKSPISPPPVATASNSFNSCSGRQTASSASPRMPAAPPGCRSGFTAISRSEPTRTAPTPGRIRSWWRLAPRSERRRIC